MVLTQGFGNVLPPSEHEVSNDSGNALCTKARVDKRLQVEKEREDDKSDRFKSHEQRNRSQLLTSAASPLISLGILIPSSFLLVTN